MSLTELPNQKTIFIDLLSMKSGSALQTMYTVLDDVPFALAVFKGESLIIEFINKYYLGIWKQRKEDVIGKPLFEARPDLKESVAHIHQEIYDTGKRYSANEVPVDVISKDKKETKYFNIVIDPIIDEKGKIIGQFATNIEVTEQVLARQKIEESEALLRKTKEQLELSIAAGKIGVWHWDVKKKQMTWSNEQLEIFGMNREEFNGEADDFLKHVIEEDQDKIRKVSGLEFQRSDNQYQFRIRRKDGEIRWIQSRSKTHMDVSGEPQYITGINIDITEQVGAHEKIQKSEEENRLFIEYAPAAMAMFDKEMRYVSVSKQWMKDYDLAGNVIGQNHYHLFPNILQRWKDVHNRCLEGGVEKSEEDFYIKDDGTPVWLRWEVHPWYNATGEIGGIVIFTENITERKKAQQYVKESEERFRAMSDEAPLFVWETDEQLQTTYLNKAGSDYFFLDESVKMSELSWKKFIHPDDLDNVLKTMWDAVEHKQSYTIEMRLRNGKSGEYHWFLDKGAPRYSNDKFIGFIGTSLDINDRKEIENELELKVRERTGELDRQNTLLQKQNELVRKIFDASVDAIGVYDTDLKIITLNQAALDIYGKKADALIGRKLPDVLPQWVGSKGHKDLLKTISGDTVHNKAYYSEVVERYYENFMMPLKDETGKVYAALVIAHDNTELISSAEKLNEAQQIAQIGHWDWDVTTNHLTWSDNLYKIYGVDKEDGINYEKFIDLVHPDDRVNMQEKIESAMQSKTYNDFFHRIITPAGEEKIMHARGEVVVNKKGKILRLVGTGQDVTKQKMIEQELIATSKKIEERNQFIEQLINSSLDLIMVVDKDLRFITVNKKAQVLYRNYYKADIIGKRITDFDPPLKGTENYNDLLEAFSGKVVIKEKVKSTISDRYYEHNYVPLTNANGEVYAVMIISHDITESTRQMEELRKLYESDEQKNNFIAMASHELKTPITSIKGYVQLILNAIEKEKDRHKPLPPLLVRSSLLSVDKQIKRLTRLISELLDISKIETGTLELKKEKFSLNELAIETIEDILYTNARHEINLYHDHHSDVFGDKDRLGQVMINFLTNAIKYSPDSEKIEVNIHKAGNNEIAFSVRDYGIGIEKEEQAKIFERFYRAKGKEEQTYPGFGIGLFIAKEFIQKHGGRIMVESEKGKGSIFTFILPVNPVVL
jgi:PAS domain S-box-containing protein